MTTPAAKLAASRAEFARVTADCEPAKKAQFAQAVLHLQHLTAARLADSIARELSDHLHAVGLIDPDLSKTDRQRVLNMLVNAQLAAVANVGAALADLSFPAPRVNSYTDITDKLYEVNARNTKDLLKPL